VLYINFQLLENKQKKQSNSRHQWLMPLLTGRSRTKFLTALLTQPLLFRCC